MSQPNKPRYGVEELYLCPRLTRPIYEATYGEQAPAYDSTKQIKRWVLPSLAANLNDVVEVQVYEAPNKLKKLYMTAKEAGTPNLPGTFVYPKYVNPGVSPAVIVGPDGSQMAMNGESLVDLVLAKAVLAEVSAATGVSFSLTAAGDPWPWKIVWGLEPRRRMNFSGNGNVFDASAVLRNRFAKGVGSPGKWSLGSDGGPVFTPDVPLDGEQDVRPEVPMPVRDLLPNERFAEVTFGGIGGVIERVDMLPQSETLGDSELLKKIAADVVAIRTVLGA